MNLWVINAVNGGDMTRLLATLIPPPSVCAVRARGREGREKTQPLEHLKSHPFTGFSNQIRTKLRD